MRVQRHNAKEEGDMQKEREREEYFLGDIEEITLQKNEYNFLGEQSNLHPEKFKIKLVEGVYPADKPAYKVEHTTSGEAEVDALLRRFTDSLEEIIETFAGCNKIKVCILGNEFIDDTISTIKIDCLGIR